YHVRPKLIKKTSQFQETNRLSSALLLADVALSLFACCVTMCKLLLSHNDGESFTYLAENLPARGSSCYNTGADNLDNRVGCSSQHAVGEPGRCSKPTGPSHPRRAASWVRPHHPPCRCR